MAPGKMLILEIGGQPVTIMVEREQLQDLAVGGYPADRNVMSHANGVGVSRDAGNYQWW